MPEGQTAFSYAACIQGPFDTELKVNVSLLDPFFDAVGKFRVISSLDST